MPKTGIFFLLMSSLLFAEADQEPKAIKGIVLTDDFSKIKEEELESLEGVHVEGASAPKDLALFTKEIAPILSALPLTANGASELCAAIASYYKHHDDVRMSVTMPEQVADNGVVRLVVAPERLGEVRVKEETYTQPENLTKWVRLSSNDVIEEKIVNEDVAWMNTSPFRTVKASFEPSEKPGVVDLDLIVKDKKSWKVATGVENTGTMPIGTTRIFTKLDVNDFIFPDHTLNLKMSTADHFSEYQSYSFKYSAPLAWRHRLKLEGSYSGTVPKRENYPQKHRQSYQANLRYQIPYWFSSNAWVDEVEYQAGFDFKGANTNLMFEDDPEPVEKKLAYVGQFVAGTSLKRKRGGNKISLDFDIIGSIARMLPHQSAEDFGNLREGATPRYVYTKLSGSMDQPFGGKWNLLVKARGQFSPSLLIPSERFSLGGYSTIRGYDEKVVGGDNAFCGNIEVQSPKVAALSLFSSKWTDSIQLVGFADGGYAWYNEAIDKTPVDQGLWSLGSGIRYDVSSYFTSRLDLGFPMRKVPKDSGNPRLHFNASFSY